jgi:acetylornithine deacetylase/succinyl-diaminopimelate desuccinylase-like protein
MDATLLSNAMDVARDDLIAFLQKMAQASSLPNHEHDVQNLIAQKLRSMGLEVEIIPSHFDDLRNHPAFGDDGFSPTERINVIGRWRGTGAGDGHSLKVLAMMITEWRGK